MIGSLRGRVLERVNDSTVLIEVAGVGYVVTVTPRTLAELEPTTDAFLHVHHHVREDAELLFGFLDRDERRTFGVLIETNGIGPTLAMAILATILHGHWWTSCWQVMWPASPRCPVSARRRPNDCCWS